MFAGVPIPIAPIDIVNGGGFVINNIKRIRRNKMKRFKVVAKRSKKR